MPKFRKTRIKLAIHSFILLGISFALFLLSSTIFPLFGGDQVLAPSGGNYAFIYGFNFIKTFFGDLVALLSFKGDLITSIFLYFEIALIVTAITFIILKFRFVLFIQVALLIVFGLISTCLVDFYFNQFLYYEGTQYSYFRLILFNSSMNLIILIYYWLVLAIAAFGFILSVLLFVFIVVSPKKIKNEKEVLKKEQFENSYPTVKEVRAIIKEELANYFKEDADSVVPSPIDKSTTNIVGNAKEDNYTL